jgi:tRNA(Ile)-lysidine synthase
MNKDKIINFENHIENSLKKLGFDLSCVEKKSLCIGVAVSGGADSVSLFVALCHISKKYKIPVRAITVNHNIRGEAESWGDADFVVSLGNKLFEQGINVKVIEKELERGKVFSVAERRGNGVEEAARFLRYEAFSEFALSEKPAFIALAHNKNDQIETLLMRFLQGSGNSGLCGICARRGIFVRPLLDVSRAQIEEYLLEQNIPWRTDSTNFDTSYMRNRIRQKLVPKTVKKNVER